MLNKSDNTIEKEFKNLRKELLDLTLRNQLLNFKSRAKTITIVNQSPINLYQTLVLQEHKMYFVANKKDKKQDKSSVWDHIPFDFSKFSEGDKKLATDLTPKELQKRLYYINNQAKTMLQEQGYNILYLAVGFLEWKDKSKPKQKNKAPLVLIPVSMERKKVGESFNLEWTGEDIQTNISLKAKLLEAGIEFPDFEFKKYGEVVDHYIASVKRSVSRMDGWTVSNDVALGFFSFTKFVMYNDLNPEAWADNVDLTKNELIQAIFNPAVNEGESFKEEDIDSRLEYLNMYQVLDADSSQIAAIQDVKAGRNLVVEGPPGTGKSQTIVNLIAELLAEGKSVLFVSEKMAALDVVKDRLTSVGLGKFVLELHSHKTRRKKFLKDLQKATNVRAQDPLNIDQTIRKLETLRRQLDDYSQIIHKPAFAVNLSPFQLYGMKEAADDHFSRKNMIMPLVRFFSPETISLKNLDDMVIALQNLAELYQTISKENPWSKCAPKSLLPADLREIEMLINDTLYSLDNFLVERGRVYDIYGIKKPDTLNEFNNSLSAFQIIKSQNAELIDGEILKSGAWDSNNDDAFRLIKELEMYQKHAKGLKKFNPSIFQADIDRLIYELRNISHKKFRFFNNKKHIELVERYYAVPVPGSIDDIIADLQYAKAVIKIRKNLEANETLGRKYFGAYWYLNANINDLKAIARWMIEFTSLVREGTFSENTIELMSNDLYDIKPERDLADYIDAGERFVSDLTKLKDKLNPRSKLIFKRETGDVSFEAWQEQLYKWRGQLSSLHLWSQYLNAKTALKGSDAEMFVDSIEKRNIKKDDVKSLVEGNFADSLLNILFVENQELATFIGELHENRIREFKDLDKQILLLNRKRIYHKLNSNIPKIFGGTEDPQAKILAGEFTRKSGHMPVRKLLEKAGGMIKQIKPCFMMSPLSIAQYLDPTNEELQFDVVIFDEASQVKPEDALGAFMRGKTAVVMGDTQQLPPTSFFDQMADADSDEEEATSLDMESILHLCKLSFPVRMLKWHYRSRHESLITVSNREFYDDDLLVYPSPSHDDPELGLKFHYNPNTAYERGSSSANPLEAEDVVDEIFNHFEKYGDTKSLGVGTFSVAQKNAILEALEVRRKQHPEFEPLFSENKEERFFVKNLETIQGDERDVILISVGYGYDNDRKLSLNFGPLNQDGGERRLNVLITRAREKCVVFSNFKAYDMHLTANPPYGVKALREFLEYAENLTLGTPHHETCSKEPFEDAIASFLEENGYQVARQIGCAGFRVDLAIIDDENPGKYILGVTTDGKMYASSKVARDRDRLREQVLSGLGWKLYHLWSTDWYRNRDLGRKKLLDYVEKSIKQTREEEKRKSEEAKRLAEKRRLEAEKKAEELRLAREREEAERKAQEEESAQSDDENDSQEFEGDVLEKPIDVSELDPSEFFADENNNVSTSMTNDVADSDDSSEFVVVEDENTDDSVGIDDGSSEFVVVENETSFETSETPSGFVEGTTSEVKEDSSINVDSLKDADAEVGEDEENVSLGDNAEVREGEKDFSNEEKEPVDETPKSFTDKVKSLFKSHNSEDDSVLSSLKFNKNLGKDSDLDDKSVDNTQNFDEKSEDKVDLGVDDDYIHVDHSNDETDGITQVNQINIDESEDTVGSAHDGVAEDSYEEVFDRKPKFGKNIDDDIVVEGSDDESDMKSESDDVVEDDNEFYVSEKELDMKSKLGNDGDIVDNSEEVFDRESISGNDGDIVGSVPHEDFDDRVDLGSDEDYIYVDHSNDEIEDGKNSSDSDSHENFDGRVDLGSDEDYIYVDHSDDEIMDEADSSGFTSQEEMGDNEISVNENISGEINQVNNVSHNYRGGRFVKSIISDVVSGESQLQQEEVETVRGEVMEEYETPLNESVPDDVNVVEAEIVNDDELNVLNDDLPDLGDGDLEKPTPKNDYFEDEELNVLNDELPDWRNYDSQNEVEDIVNDAKEGYLDDMFGDSEIDIHPRPETQSDEIPDEKIVYQSDEVSKGSPDEEIDYQNDEITDDGVTYYQGSNDVTSKLRKNNVYYEEEERPKTVRGSLKGIKKDMQYINKSLKAIENPTHVDYISVVDRTEEYNPEDYLNMPSDDDSDLIIEREKELTFAEKEERRIERELNGESFSEENTVDEDVIVPVHPLYAHEEAKDRVLEDIIQTANEDYKEIEKERFKKDNQLKAFDDHILPGKKKLEDNIFTYVKAEEIGLKSSDDLYKQPVSNVASSVKVIVDVEGPIHIKEVMNRIKDSCHIKRAGSNLKKTVNSAIEYAESSGDIIKIGDFLYDASNNDVIIRKRTKPNIDLISDEEIAKSIELVLIYNNNLSTNQIAKVASSNFGFKSTSKKTAARINSVLDLMIANNKVKIENNIVELK